MKSQAHSKTTHTQGSSLMEVVIAVGVLAIAVPLIFGSIVESGNAGQYSSAETRAPWMVRACMEEIKASRSGKARFFTNTNIDQAFPPAGEIWALAFSETGSLVGSLSREQYDGGLRKLENSDIRYIATIQSSSPPPDDPDGMALPVRITIEFPAAVPAAKRRTIDFHTRVP